MRSSAKVLAKFCLRGNWQGDEAPPANRTLAPVFVPWATAPVAAFVHTFLRRLELFS